MAGAAQDPSDKPAQPSTKAGAAASGSALRRERRAARTEVAGQRQHTVVARNRTEVFNPDAHGEPRPPVPAPQPGPQTGPSSGRDQPKTPDQAPGKGLAKRPIEGPATEAAKGPAKHRAPPGLARGQASERGRTTERYDPAKHVVAPPPDLSVRKPGEPSKPGKPGAGPQPSGATKPSKPSKHVVPPPPDVSSGKSKAKSKSKSKAKAKSKGATPGRTTERYDPAKHAAPPPGSPRPRQARRAAQRTAIARASQLAAARRPDQAAANGLPTVGETIDGRYRIVRPIGIGGMGHVFAVDRVGLDKTLALKVLSPAVVVAAGGEAQKARFMVEARAASKLRHPSIVEVTDFGTTEGGLPYLVMEYLEGEDLADRLDRDGALSWPQSRDIVLAVLDALAVAHDNGVVHRDIKPENCFLAVGDDPSGPPQLKLLDFGIAKVLDEGGAGGLTQRGELLGTPQYMSPEQAVGQPVDTRSDVYAVGILLYELLTGLPPFNDEAPMEVLRQQITMPPPPLLSKVPTGSVLPAVVDAVDKALAKAPADRFATVTAFAEALRQADAPKPQPVAPAAPPAPGDSGRVEQSPREDTAAPEDSSRLPRSQREARRRDDRRHGEDTGRSPRIRRDERSRAKPSGRLPEQRASWTGIAIGVALGLVLVGVVLLTLSRG